MPGQKMFLLYNKNDPEEVLVKRYQHMYLHDVTMSNFYFSLILRFIY